MSKEVNLLVNKDGEHYFGNGPANYQIQQIKFSDYSLNQIGLHAYLKAIFPPGFKVDIPRKKKDKTEYNVNIHCDYSDSYITFVVSAQLNKHNENYVSFKKTYDKGLITILSNEVRNSLNLFKLFLEFFKGNFIEKNMKEFLQEKYPSLKITSVDVENNSFNVSVENETRSYCLNFINDSGKFVLAYEVCDDDGRRYYESIETKRRKIEELQKEILFMEEINKTI